MTEIFSQVQMYCGVGKINTTIFLKDGKVEDRGFGFTEGICPGCKRNRKELVQTDMDNAGSTRTSITLADRARFGGRKEIVVICSGPVDPLLEGF